MTEHDETGPDEHYTARDGDILTSLLNELATSSWPLDSFSDHVHLHRHADGHWQVQVGGPSLDPDFYDSREYPTLVAALHAVVAVYRKYPAGALRGTN
jgi:hypothetical protein